MIATAPLTTFTTAETTRQADILFNARTKTAVIVTKTEYLPMDKFREIFDSLSVLFAKQPISTLIFDKRSLRVFHQPSMEWYYKEWKTVMLEKWGLRNHYKLLPQDSMFRKSVEIGRSKILSDLPSNSPLLQLNIRYFETLEDALDA
ncbi:hypothetical protein [Cesiribacter andamanensis]|uniref:Uncharacterized protein n=1 Tax=Cesiribacter andamanensis AMV16 TaxID=1279009 RepID=M7N9H6_9BACT|nr:hypothetical protein [Cesiribacter andamanensis]EMR03917.1 hypothetical protein ADICEAN_00974 [Cesiribacter andamanensis AMV16]